MLNRRDGFGIARMEIEITVPNRKNSVATPADQPAGASEQVIGMV